MTFKAQRDGFVDEQTGSTWNLLGAAIAGPLVGKRLSRFRKSFHSRSPGWYSTQVLRLFGPSPQSSFTITSRKNKRSIACRFFHRSPTKTKSRTCWRSSTPRVRAPSGARHDRDDNGSQRAKRPLARRTGIRPSQVALTLLLGVFSRSMPRPHRLDGTLHRKLGARPNSAFLIDKEGTIVFRAHWANEAGPLRRALADVAGGRKPSPATVSRTPLAVMKAVGYMGPVLAAAGRGAKSDTWKVAPPMGVMMTLSDLLFFLPANKRGKCVVGMTAIGAMLVGLALRY